MVTVEELRPLKNKDVEPVEVRETFRTSSGARLVIVGNPRIIRNNRGRAVKIDLSTINTKIELDSFPDNTWQNPTLSPAGDIQDSDDRFYIENDVEKTLTALNSPGDYLALIRLINDVRAKTRDANAAE